MIGNSIACAALLVSSAPCWAELSVNALDKQPFDTQIAEFFQLGQGDLFLRLRGWREGKPPSETRSPWSAVYLLAPDGQVKQRVQLPDGVYQVIVPYRNGFAIQRLVRATCAPQCGGFDGSEPIHIVAYEHATDPQPKVLYQTQPDSHTARLVGAPDDQDLYLLEAGIQGHLLTRIDAHGQVVWQKPGDWVDFASFVATDDGIALAQLASAQDPAMVLKALDRDGRMRWETRLPFRISQEALFSSAGFITLQTHAQGGRQRLVNFDARTGALIADVEVQPSAYAVGTKDGLLLAGPMLGQSYVGMLSRDGKFSWLRRYVADQQVNDIQRAVMTRAGELALISRERQPSTVTPITSVVITDRTAASLAKERGGCLEPRWTRSVKLAAELQSRGLYVEPPKAEDLASDRTSCSEGEIRFIAFMQELASVLRPPAQGHDPRLIIAVRLTAAGEPLRLESYSADRSGYPTAGVYLSFASPFDRAAEFSKIISTLVLPHLERMRAFDEQFAQLTGFRYVVIERNELNYEQTLTELEKAAQTINERVGSISPEKLAEVRKRGATGYVQILLRLDAFGAGDGAMYPVAVADRTFLAIVEQNRRDAEQGNITIRD